MTLEHFLSSWGFGQGQGLLVTLGVTFIAGVMASAVCPCTLPVGLGVAGAASVSERSSRKGGLAVALAFFAGIVLNLTLLGALVGRLGALATEAFGRYWALGMMVLSLAAAAVAFAGPRLKVSRLASLRRPGLAGAFGYGFIFSLGTSVAPLLLLLTVAAGQGRPEDGLVLALAFGLGRGLPFLLAGLAAGAVVRFTRLGTWGRSLQVLSGAALLLVSGYFAHTFLSLL